MAVVFCNLLLLYSPVSFVAPVGFSTDSVLFRLINLPFWQDYVWQW